MDPLVRRHFRHVVFQIVASWIFTIGYAVFASTAAIVTAGRCSASLTPWLLRVWGKAMLWIAGVRLEVEGTQHLPVATGNVAVFNHSSMLDTFVITAIMPRSSVAAVKREALFFPGIGLAITCLRFLIIDRSNTARARKTLEREAGRIGAERLTVFIAPEGTRTRDGQLLPFKRGAFYLAVSSGAPVVPVVLHGGFDLQPYGRWWSIPGVVRVSFLPAIATGELSAADVPALADRVRAQMQGALSLARAEAPVRSSGPARIAGARPRFWPLPIKRAVGARPPRR